MSPKLFHSYKHALKSASYSEGYISNSNQNDKLKTIQRL